MAVTGGYDQSGSYPAAVDRRIVAAALAHASGTALSVRSGVIAGAGQQLAVSASSGMNVSVGTGRAVISATSGGAYQVINDAALTLTLGASTSQPRIDLVVARFRDSELGDGAPVGPAIEVVAGTPAASPVAPSPGSRAVALAQIAVGASVSSITSGNITDTRQYAGPGGPIRIPGALLQTPAALGVPEGVEVYDPNVRAVAIAVAGNSWLYQSDPVFGSVSTRNTYFDGVSGSPFVFCTVAGQAYAWDGNSWEQLTSSRQGVVFPATVSAANDVLLAEANIGPFSTKMDVSVKYLGYAGYRADGANVVVTAVTVLAVANSSGHAQSARGVGSLGGVTQGIGYRPVHAHGYVMGLQAGGTVNAQIRSRVSLADALTAYAYHELHWTATPAA